MAKVVYLFDKRHRKIAEFNLKRTKFVEHKEIQNFIKNVYKHLILFLRELLRFFFFPKDVLKRCRFIEIEPYEGQRIFFSGHLSNWEIMIYAHAMLRGKIAIVGKSLKNPYADALLNLLRKRGGVLVIHPDEPLKVMRFLRNGYSIGFLIDQYPVGEDYCEVNFFGIKTRCTTAPARLSLLTGIPMQAGFITRNGDFYEITYGRMIKPQGKNVEEIMKEATEIIENEIRRRPLEYLWFHRRWRGD